MKVYRGCGDIAPLNLKFGTRRRRFINFKPRPIYPWESKPVPTEYEVCYDQEPVCGSGEEKILFASTGIKTQGRLS